MKKLLFATFSIATVSFLACSSSSTTASSDAGTDSGVSTTRPDGSTSDTDGGPDNTTDGSMADGGFAGCTSFTDNTANTTVAIAWGFSVTADPNHCSTIKVGTTVTWTGDFVTHPLDAFPRPDANNPVSNAGNSADGGASVSITFTTAGLYGYQCDNHVSMIGAIQVVP